MLNQRARETKRKLRRQGLTRDDEIERHLHALQTITDPSGTADFTALLAKLQEEYDNPTDYTDNSPTITAMTTSGELLQVTDDMFLADELTLLEHGTLEGLYKSRIDKLKFMGLPRPELLTWLQQRVPHRVANVMSLLTTGCTIHMKPEWKVNGFKGVLNGKDSELYTSIAQHAAAKLHNDGRIVLLRLKSMADSFLTQLNGIPTVMAHNENKIPRVCHHLSKGTKANPSYNDMIDFEAHLRTYPRAPLITLGTLADAAHAMREDHPDCEYLHAAIMDVRTAYQQFLVSYDKFVLIWNKFDNSPQRTARHSPPRRSGRYVWRRRRRRYLGHVRVSPR